MYIVVYTPRCTRGMARPRVGVLWCNRYGATLSRIWRCRCAHRGDVTLDNNVAVRYSVHECSTLLIGLSWSSYSSTTYSLRDSEE